MAPTADAIFPGGGRSEWIRLRTLIVLRWIAIIGQITAVTVAGRVFDLNFDIGLCFLVIGCAVVANTLAVFLYPENKRLTEFEAASMLLFDIGQLGILLYLTGGLHNPFALLILAPVTIGATALKLRSILFLGLVTITLISFVALYHIPLRMADGTVLQFPTIFLFGFWLAIVIGVSFQAVYTRQVSEEMHTMSDALLATQMALAREQKLTDLGGVIAAAAHELGTPLATITLVSAELMEDLEPGSDLRDDAVLIRDQADRCRDILRSMGRAGKDDLHLRHAPITAVIEEAAQPHADRGKALHVDAHPTDRGDLRQPVVRRQPEIIHGLRNLVQNAVDFAEANVWIDVIWSPEDVVVRIADDGDGYPAQVIGRIGDPFVRRRRGEGDRTRPAYEGMGLGLFIAKTLLERSGAELTFANGVDPFLAPGDHPERKGAVVEVAWPRALLDRFEAETAGPLGENQPLEA